MAWDSYLTEDGWNSPRFPNAHILKNGETYAESYSDMFFDMELSTNEAYYFHCYDFRVINDARHPIFIMPIDSTGEIAQYGLNPISPLYSSTFNYHGVVQSIETDDPNATLEYYPLDHFGSYAGCGPFDYPNTQLLCNIITNIPCIFVDKDYCTSEQIDLTTLRANYLNNGDLSIFDELIESGHARIMNEMQTPEPKSAAFTIYNTGQKDIWRTSGSTFVSGPYYRWCKIKMLSTNSVDGRFAFYRQGLNDGKIKLVPVSVADVVSCEYSTDGATWQSSDSFPFDYIYGERIDELGEFISATRTGIGGDTGVPCFATEAEALGWCNHDPSVDISDALNYEDIANRYGITNPTGAKETSTTMGDGGASLRGYFSHDYIMSYGSVAEISDAFFDVGPQGIWESIKDGIEMMGANPIDCIAGLKCYNLDLTQILTGLSDYNFIYFGGYKYDLQQGNVKRVINYGGYKDLGTFTIEDAFSNPNDFRNFEPYCKLKIYIPTVGIQELSYNKYRGKTITVRMYLDIKSGNTLMCLLANNVLYDYFNGSCGVDLPICLTDKAALSQAQIRNVSNLAGVGINMGTAAATKDIGAALAGVANFGSSMLDLNNTSADQFNVTKGGSSPMGNAYFLPDYIYLIFEYIKTAETGNLQQLEGRITNKSGNLGSFSGHLQVDSIQLQTSANMSESEKNEFVSLLQSGIFI